MHANARVELTAWRSRTQVKRGVMYTSEEAEGKRLKNPFDTITEGIGINRLTANFNRALIDDAFRGGLLAEAPQEESSRG